MQTRLGLSGKDHLGPIFTSVRPAAFGNHSGAGEKGTAKARASVLDTAACGAGNQRRCGSALRVESALPAAPIHGNRPSCATKNEAFGSRLRGNDHRRLPGDSSDSRRPRAHPLAEEGLALWLAAHVFRREGVSRKQHGAQRERITAALCRSGRTKLPKAASRTPEQPRAQMR